MDWYFFSSILFCDKDTKVIWIFATKRRNLLKGKENLYLFCIFARKYIIPNMKINSKIKEIGGFVGSFFTAVTFVFAGIQFLHDTGGTLQATLNGEVLENNSHRDVIICLDKPQAANSLSALYPTFSNSSSYSIRDFYLSYHVKSSSVMFEPTDYYTLYNDAPGCYSLKYKESVLPGSRSVENPIREIIVAENGGSLTFSSDVTYDGSSEPYIYELNAQYMVVPNDEGLTYEQWKQKCQKQYLASVGNKETPVFYLTSDGHVEYAVSIALAPSNESAHVQEQKPDDTRQIAQNVEPAKPKPSPAPKPTPAPVKPKAEPVKPAQAPAKPAPVVAQPVQTQTTSVESYIESVTQNPAEYKGEMYNCISYRVSSACPDTTLMICELLEDTMTHKFDNDMCRIVRLGYSGSYGYYRQATSRLQDYAFCTENPALADSVKFNKEFVRNNTRRTIGIYCENDSNRVGKLIAPHKSTWIGKDENRRCTFYDVPQQILADQYAPIPNPFSDMTGVVKDGFLWGLMGPLYLLGLGIFFLCVISWEDGFNLKTLKKEFIEVWKDACKYRITVLKWLALVYFGSVGLIILAELFGQLSDYYDWFV